MLLPSVTMPPASTQHQNISANKACPVNLIAEPVGWLGHCLLLGLVASNLTAILTIPSKSVMAFPTVVVAQVPPRPTLRLGSTGNSVEEVQALLTLLGYYNKSVDGEYQATTEAAVRVFQGDVGLISDGVVGPETWAKLLPTPSTNFTPPPVPAEIETAVENADPKLPEEQSVDLPTLRKGMSGPAVTRIQETLERRGYYDGPIDGAFGPGTEAAVMAFQRDAQLAADGVIGPATWQALLR